MAPNDPVRIVNRDELGLSVAEQMYFGRYTSGLLDPFMRQRVSEPQLQFDAQHEYDIAPLLWNTITTPGGSAAHLPNESSVLLSIDTTPDASVLRIQKDNSRYQPGNGQKLDATFNFTAPVENVAKYVGYGNLDDGVSLRQTGDGRIAFVVRSSTSGTPQNIAVIYQDDWNEDPLNGLGRSGINLNWEFSQNMVPDLQWLGVGRVRLGFYIQGRIIYAHFFDGSNVLPTVYMRTANLPVMYRIVADGAAAGEATLKQICCSVVSEQGPIQERGYRFSSDMGITAATFDTTLTPILAVRPAATFKTLPFRGRFIIRGLDMTPVSGTGPFRWALIYNPTIVGGAWAADAAHDSESASQKNTTMTSFTGGIQIASGYINATNIVRENVSIDAEFQRYPWVHDNAGNQIAYLLACQDVAGSSEILASMTWRELR